MEKLKTNKQKQTKHFSFKTKCFQIANPDVFKRSRPDLWFELKYLEDVSMDSQDHDGPWKVCYKVKITIILFKIIGIYYIHILHAWNGWKGKRKKTV